MLQDGTNSAKKTMDFSRDFEIEAAAPEKSSVPAEIETDPRKLRQRQKQIDYGKNTLGYEKYARDVPRSKRGNEDPRTPDKYRVCSKRAFEGLLKVWRRRLHEWDPCAAGGDSAQPVPTPATPSLDAHPSAPGRRGKDLWAEQGGSNDDHPSKRGGSPADVSHQSSAGNKRNHPDSAEGQDLLGAGGVRGDMQRSAPKAARIQAASSAAQPAQLPPLRPSQPIEAAADAADEELEPQPVGPAIGRPGTDDGLVWRVDNIPDESEGEYEIDNTWDEDDVGL